MPLRVGGNSGGIDDTEDPVICVLPRLHPHLPLRMHDAGGRRPQELHILKRRLIADGETRCRDSPPHIVSFEYMPCNLRRAHTSSSRPLRPSSSESSSQTLGTTLPPPARLLALQLPHEDLRTAPCRADYARCSAWVYCVRCALHVQQPSNASLAESLDITVARAPSRASLGTRLACSAAAPCES
ncbi:hypothetical protein DFH09DRAFT_1171774 [Mycena vulgaris]|nr:hypothetical protein DFH09DRAFT_1171774 [Mycena vulgaris]